MNCEMLSKILEQKKGISGKIDEILMRPMVQ